MRLKQVHLQRFKRFTNTTIRNIPETAKLIIIAGPNGSGKSSFFEGLNTWMRSRSYGLQWETEYFVKLPEQGDLGSVQAVTLDFHGHNPGDIRKAFYIRSAYRNDPEFQIGALKRMGPVLEEARITRLIENDAVVGKNYQRLAGQALESLFEQEAGTTTVDELRKKLIGDIKTATQRLFPDLVMNSLGNPLTTGTFRFDKGDAKSFHYKNLSGGEKSAFDLLLDIIVKRRDFDDTIFCIDEPEAHMNSRLQGALLVELYRAIGDKCQLWLATHSAGMMRQARDLERYYPGSVVFLDFGGRDFDQPQIIEPERPTRAFWQRVFDVAFDDFAALMAPREVVLCEGRPIGLGGPSEGLDAKIYETIFAEEFPETRFIPVGSSSEVEADRLALIEAMQSLVRGTKVRRLIDRDDMSEEDIVERRRSGVSVLGRRNIESYLFDDELIRALAARHGRDDLAVELITFKASEMRRASSDRHRPADDVKASAGAVVAKLKRELRLTQCGNTPKEFMRVTLAPLLTPQTAVYAELRASVFPTAL